MTQPLPIPDDPAIGELIEAWIVDPSLWEWRSRWLSAVESILQRHYPDASSDELTLTARNLAPFSLALPNVP